jgi:membrane protein DedA with SNARE-associated domain
VTLLSVLPLAFVMIAGPQIISAVFFATSVNWKGTSAAYVLGAAVSITAFFTAAYFLGKGAKAGGSEKGSSADWLDVVVLVLLVAAAIYTFLKRKTSHPPKWMAKLQTATPRFAFLLGLALLGVFPTDILTSVSVGMHLAAQGKDWVEGIPFIVLTLLLLALPATLVVLLGHRAKTFLPKVRDWMNTNSWIVSEIVIALFIVITINSIAG